MASEFLLATRSADKAREIGQILHALPHLRLRTLSEAGVAASPEEEQIETESTFAGNALAKARYFAKLTAMPVVADDSGLMVAALNGAPGVRTKRFAADNGITRGDVDQANNEVLLEKLQGVPIEQRGAAYVCAAACVYPDGREFVALGTCAGYIGFEPRGTGGFGYDPLFLMPARDLTFAQLSAEEKHRHSHRARAFRALAPHLK